jgi:hypothetical protein
MSTSWRSPQPMTMDEFKELIEENGWRFMSIFDRIKVMSKEGFRLWALLRLHSYITDGTNNYLEVYYVESAKDEEYIFVTRHGENDVPDFIGEGFISEYDECFTI